MGWIIAAAIIALIFLLLMLKARVKVKVDGDMKLTLGVLIFRIPLYPGKEKTLKLSDYKIKKFRKKQAKLEKEKSGKKSRKKAVGHKPSDSKTRMVEVDDSGNDITELISTIIEVVKVFFERFGHHLHIKLKRLVIIIATPDAAKTAVLYGAVCGAVQCLLELLGNAVHLKVPNSDDICVMPDFTSEKTSAQVDITFSLRVYQVLDILIRSAVAYFKKS